MIKCPDCGASQYAGTLFCSECGRFLLEASSAQTAPLPFTQFGQLPSPPPLAAGDLEISDEPKSLVFMIPVSRQRVEIELNPEVYVGRGDKETGIVPELDLTTYQGAAYGVSRRHAKLQTTNAGIVLIDLNSTNGTYLNNFRLAPQQPYLLQHGDEVQFGELLLHVFVLS